MSRSTPTDALDTPMMQQYQRIKAEVGDAILFYRLGDFYEMFHEDALVASRALDITLTARGREHGRGFPMCGVPHHSAEGHVAKLVRLGHRVAICDQVEDPRAAKGVVRREVVRIVTPGTTLDERCLPADENAFLTAVLAEQGRIGLAHVSPSTGELRISEHDPESRFEVGAELATFQPREILLPEGADRDAVAGLLPRGVTVRFTEVDPWTFSRHHALEAVRQRWRVAGLGAWGLESRPAATRAVGAVLAYLSSTQRSGLDHVEPPRLVDAGATVVLDASTRRNLELVESLRDGSRAGSLLSVLDRTRGSMGARTLRSWLLAPLRDAGAIEARLDAVESLRDGPRADRLDAGLRGLGDLERLLSRVVLRSAGPREVRAVADALRRVPEVAAALQDAAPLLRGLAASLDPLPDLRASIEATLAEQPPATVRDG